MRTAAKTTAALLGLVGVVIVVILVLVTTIAASAATNTGAILGMVLVLVLMLVGAGGILLLILAISLGRARAQPLPTGPWFEVSATDSVESFSSENPIGAGRVVGRLQAPEREPIAYSGPMSDSA